MSAHGQRSPLTVARLITGNGNLATICPMDTLRFSPQQGEDAFQFCWHDRKGIELRTNEPDDRVIARHHHGQLRPCNPEVWAGYFRPPIFINAKGHRI